MDRRAFMRGWMETMLLMLIRIEPHRSVHPITVDAREGDQTTTIRSTRSKNQRCRLMTILLKGCWKCRSCGCDCMHETASARGNDQRSGRRCDTRAVKAYDRIQNLPDTTMCCGAWQEPLLALLAQVGNCLALHVSTLCDKKNTMVVRDCDVTDKSVGRWQVCSRWRWTQVVRQSIIQVV